MKSHSIQRARALLLPAAVATLCATSAFAQDAVANRSDRPVPPLSARPRLTHDRVLYDEPGDGALWALGAKYKASFGRDGATFIPAFGSRAPKNYPHALSPDRVTVGGLPLALGTSNAERTADRVVLQRGAFLETYDLGLDSMEQSFVFDSLPGAGALVVHIPVASELEGSENPAGLEFRSDFGTLTYSRAIAIDALGQRFDAPTRLVDGAIEIEVSAADLAGATLPLVIDPVVGTLHAILTTDDHRNTDSAWDAWNGCWLVTWTHAYSATDNDVYGRTITPFGFADSTIDFTGASWNVPRCAHLASAHQFMVVASVVSGNTVPIMCRTVTPSGSINVLGSQVTISGPDAGAKTNPDIGGDSVSDSTQAYCVVWERADPANSGNTHIACRLVDSTSTPLGANATYVTASHPFWTSVLPTVSKTANGLQWLIAYTFNDPLNHADTWAARMSVTGSLLESTFLVTSGLGWETQPVASSFQTGTSRAVIAYKYRTTATGQNDIWVAVLDGATPLGGANITALENSGFQAMDQIDPAIDCDGQHFVLAYSEFDPNFLTWDVFADDIALVGNTVKLTQTHVPVQPYGLSEYRSQVAAARNTTNSPSHRYCISWDFRENDQDYDVIFKTFDAFEGGTSGPFCFGDGSGTACPCGNTGGAQRGCASSDNLLGARLTLLSGSVSTVNDTAILGASSMPPGTACLLFQGTTQDVGTPFGDGLMCATGSLTRMFVKFAPTGSITFPAPGDPTLSTTGAVPLSGGLRTYQVWYRDSAVFCTAATNNLTNGYLINWAR